MRRHALQILLLANAALALVLLWLWFLPDGSMRNVHWQPPEARKTDLATILPALPGVGSADTSQFISMLDRPLFAITRRPPPPPPPPEAAPPTDNLSTARLSGVYQGAGGGGIIIALAGKDRRARLNDAIEGWKVQAINGRDVTFARGGQRRVLTLPRAALTTDTTQAAPPLGSAKVAPQPQPLPPATRPVTPASEPAQGAAQPPAAPQAPPKATFGGSRR